MMDGDMSAPQDAPASDMPMGDDTMATPAPEMGGEEAAPEAPATEAAPSEDTGSTGDESVA